MLIRQIAKMVKIFIKLNDSDSSFEIVAKKGSKVLGESKGVYDKDLADKIIRGLDKILAYVKIEKRNIFRAYYDSQSKSFVSNLMVNSVVNAFNWLQKN
jgi:pyruvate-formate lyase-activating enzyme